MWGSLRADFTEFVSVVTTDASDTLAAFDDRLDDDGEERYATPLIDADTGIVIEQPPPAPSPPKTMEEKRAFLYTCEGVFLDELVVVEDEDAANTSMESWLEQFDIENQTDEISTLLKDHPNTLGDTFSKLTDQVEYSEFWKRYFYRLGSDDDRLDATYEEYYFDETQHQEASQTQTTQRAGAAYTSVTNFLGGAVKRLVEDSDDDDDSENEENAGTAQTSAASALNFFGGGGRPPFVLNTAVSEDEDQDEEEEEEEEELGWDDEDEEDGDDDDEDGNHQEDENEDTHDHQIEFKDAEKERLQEELDQAMAERDLLHTTVEMQTHEIQKLKELFEGADDSKQVEALKMQIFEKDAELAALRASLDDTHEDDEESAAVQKDAAKQASQERELERLAKGVSERDAQLADLQEQLVHTKEALAASEHALQEERDQKGQVLEKMTAEAQSDKAALEQANEETADCKSQLQALQDTVSLLQSENTQLKEVQQHESGDQAQQLVYAQQGMEQAKADMEHFQAQTIQLQADLDASTTQTESLDAELLQTKAALEDARTELAKAAAQPSSPGSISTGISVPEAEEVKVPVLPEVKVPEVEEVQEEEHETPTVTKMKGSDDGEEDAWGDDW